jgi:hypothetical protein
VESFLHGGSIEDEATTMVLATSSDDMETFFPAGDINYGTQLIKTGKV